MYIKENFSKVSLNTKIPSKFILRTFFNFIPFLMGRFFYFFSICSVSSTVLLSLPFSLRFFWFHQLASLYSLLWIFWKWCSCFYLFSYVLDSYCNVVYIFQYSFSLLIELSTLINLFFQYFLRYFFNKNFYFKKFIISITISRNKLPKQKRRTTFTVLLYNLIF